MDLKAIANAVEQFAPTVAAMLGGPMAGQGVSILESVLGLTPGAGAPAVAAQLQQATLTSDQVVALRLAELEHAEKLRQQGIDLAAIKATNAAAALRADVDDRSSARSREIAVRDLTPKILAFAIVAICFGLEAAVLFGLMPATVDKVMAGRILGTFDASSALVLAYYYGSSSGAKRAQELLAQSTPAAA